MRTRKIIPRRDHEAYFVLIPPELKKKQIRSFIFDRLEELHPGFSATTAFDMQTFVFNNQRWIMATVMEGEILAEYRILNKNAVLYTNTAILVRGKEFITRGIVSVDDENIGFDDEKNEPVSVPVEIRTGIDTHYFDNELRRIPSRYGVFNKKMPKLLIAGIVVVFLMALLPFVFNRGEQNQDAVKITEVEIAPEANYMPPAILILSAVSEKTLEAGGEIVRWQYNENVNPFIIIQFKGLETLSAYAVFEGMNHLALEDIQDVRYTDGTPYFTVFANSREDVFLIPPAAAFSVQESALAVITDVTDILKRQEVSIVSETLPSAGNGNAFYTLTYAAEDWNFIRSLEVIEYACSTHSFRVKSLDISINSDKTIFTVICTFSYCEGADLVSSLGDEKYLIPAAFGYLNGIPAAEAADDIMPFAEPPVIGSIRDAGGKIIYYRDVDGKIKTRGEQ